MRIAAVALLVAFAALSPVGGCGPELLADGGPADSSRAGAPPARPVVALDLRPSGSLSPAVAVAARIEARAIWRSAGVEIGPASHTPGEGLEVVMLASAPRTGTERRALPLGGILFEDGRPEREIQVYYRAVAALAARAGALLLPGRHWTPAERDRVMGRVLGRVIAHEIGHFLLGSARHTPSGLMKAGHSPAEFVAESRSPFRLSRAQAAALRAPAAQ